MTSIAPEGISTNPLGTGTFPVSPIPAVNVASVPQRSPLRYPGGKTWLVPHIRAWLSGNDVRLPLIVEPFCGGAIASLTAVMEGYVERCLMAELDRDVAAFWHAATRHGLELRKKVAGFEISREAVDALSCEESPDPVEQGFRTLVLNRTRRGGILAPGAALSRLGENGKGIGSRWYPETIIARLDKISEWSHRIAFCETDGLHLLEALAPLEGIAVFVDPPYTAGGKRAGKRLYANNEIDHAHLFSLLANSRANFLMTYDHAPEIVDLVRQHSFSAVEVFMKNTHHNRVSELVITREPVFAKSRLL